MIQFEKFVLPNGLRCLVHEDHSTPMVAVNLMYDVGARDEDPSRTGFAHLFEHLMFGGSVSIPDYDEPLQRAGGENNAYTTNDLTNYYIQLPARNLETAFWLESDRMLSLGFSEKSLDVQRKVVCEEFKEHYLNKPYGDVWFLLRSLCYTKHPYQWMTIGRKLSHIEQASLDDVKHFFFKHYRPVNAILCVAGHTTLPEVKQLAEKWFGPIPSGDPYLRNIPQEPEPIEANTLWVRKPVPVSLIMKAWLMPARLEKDYYAADMITEVLSGGQSSRLYQRLVKEKKIFSQIDCYHTGSIEQGLLVIDGKILPGIEPQDANQAILAEINDLIHQGISESELEKVRNKIESMLAFEDLNLLHRANNLAFYELLGDAQRMNLEFEFYRQVSSSDIQRVAQQLFKPERTNTLFYLAEQENPESSVQD